MNIEKIYFLNLDLGIKHTGVESSALLRSKLFINQLDLKPTFITSKYRSQSAVEVRQLKAQNKLAADVEVINLYDYFQSHTSNNDNALSIYDGEVVIPVSGTQPQRYLDANGKLKVSVFYNQLNQCLHYIVHFLDQKKWRRDYYHEGGNLSCTHLFDNQGQKVTQEIFYRGDGSLCLIKSHFYKEDGTRALTQIQVVDSHGQVVKVLKDEKELIGHLLWLYFEEKQETSVLLIDRNSLFYKSAINMRKQFGSDKVKVISAIHNVHAVNYQQKETSRINVNYVSVFDDLSQPDAVIVQTNAQRRDIIDRFGDTSNVYAIPHSYESTFKKTDEIVRDPFKAVCFARYSSDKNHELAIEAFAKVVKKLPRAEFHCYGSGLRLTELQEMVKSLAMTQNIFLHGWCDSVAEEYESAALSIISSASESFSLTIAESLAHGCPVVGFDVPYGQKELIQTGVNGYLVSFKETEAMADSVVQIMSNPKLQRELSTNARKSSQRYSESEVKFLWQEVFKKIF